MPQLNSFADVLTDLERLLAAAEANAPLLPGLEVAKAPLERVIADLRSLAVRRDNLNADKQVLTAELAEAFGRGKETGSQFRGFVRSHLGMRNEKLVEFRIPPRRLGTRAKRGQGAKPATPKPTPPVAPGGPVSGGGGASAVAGRAGAPGQEGGATGGE